MPTKPIYTNTILIAYIDNSNVYQDNIYIPYSYNDSTEIGKRFGVSVSGKKLVGIKGARFYVFGGKDDSGYYHNDLLSFDVTIQGGGPYLANIVEIVPDGTYIPSERVFSSLKMVNDGLLVYGGMNEEGIALTDLQKYTFATNQWEELSVSGNPPSPRILCGEMN